MNVRPGRCAPAGYGHDQEVASCQSTLSSRKSRYFCAMGSCACESDAHCSRNRPTWSRGSRPRLGELENELIGLPANLRVEHLERVIVTGAVQCITFTGQSEAGRGHFLNDRGLIDAM